MWCLRLTYGRPCKGAAVVAFHKNCHLNLRLALDQLVLVRIQVQLTPRFWQGTGGAATSFTTLSMSARTRNEGTMLTAYIPNVLEEMFPEIRAES
jgi:hypothetical protein